MCVLETRRRPEHPRTDSGRRSTIAWRLTVGSGAALLVLLAVHMVAQHFVVDEVGGLRTYQQVLDYISHPLVLTIECLLLVTVTIHAMIGLRSMLHDVDLSSRARRLVDRGLVALGSLTLAYGFVLLGVLAWRA
jgi:succinate dehydrogenase hydrophobic anchor subunit